MSVLRAPAAGFDTAPIVLRDVIEVGGTILERRADTLAIEVSYVIIADKEHRDERKTIRRRPQQVLPEVVLIPVEPGVRIEPLGPSRLHSLAMPVLVGVSVVLYLLYAHW